MPAGIRGQSPNAARTCASASVTALVERRRPPPRSRASAAHPTDFRSAHARWIQPKISCPAAQDVWGVSWAGMDGWWNDVVEQGGSSARRVNGIAQYVLWWEMFPHNDIHIASPAEPGDPIDAAVTCEPATRKFRIVVKDLITGRRWCRSSPATRKRADALASTPS
ncbi:hypothetical protein G3I59_02210 [Amycolatopsis rubida]|uniref:Uncharacterized protein n=1 Tax=Amycolatopsis rubida TaxID=112413 RepID=A0ABX0BJ35_9PSEU|nr:MULTISPECIES: G1 family glutamic endopeptidase [Amycolatopsis]MYW89472.1 hypothetical protein [Amycolatopsis rubida]NEC54449.1 hypothetical protein [Amycolatopsis rubida]